VRAGSWSVRPRAALSRAAGRTGDWRVGLGLIVLVGLGLRLWGILHGLREGFVYHPDAQVVVHDAWQHYLGAPWRTGRFGAAYGFLVTLAMWTLEVIARLAGWPFTWSFELIAVAASLLSAAAGTLTIPLVYLLGTRAYGRTAGLLGAALLAVDPIHTLHSHYPYRDAPMLAFLVLALVACVSLAERPTTWALALGAVTAACATALKTSAFLLILPILAAAGFALRRGRWVWGLGAAGFLLAAALAGIAMGNIPTLWGLPVADLSSPLGVVRSLGRFVARYLSYFAGELPVGIVSAILILREGLGSAWALALAAAVLHAIRRHGRADLVLLALAIPTLLFAAMFPWLDERYLLPLLPLAAVMLGRLVSEAWETSRRLGGRSVIGRGSWRIGLGLAVGVLLLLGLGRSVRHGILLTLPDTRALAGHWAEAHLPHAARVTTEGYFPLGLDRWPGASFFDPTKPVAHEVARSDVLVTSSLQHSRYLGTPTRYPAEARFFRELPRHVVPMRAFALDGFGFIHPRIDFYVPGLAPGPPPQRLLLPRPFDPSWSFGVSFLDAGPYDRDDRTVRLTPSQNYALTLLSPAPVDEIAVFVAAGPAPVRVRAAAGWRSRAAVVAPGELAVLRLRPRSWLPMRPVLYRLRVSLSPEGGPALVQIRGGAREIGETLAEWGRWGEAIPHLERAAGGGGGAPPDPRDPPDLGLRLLLVTAYQRAGRLADARRTLAALRMAAPDVVERHLALGKEAEPPEGWARAFRAATGLDATLLTASLGVVLEAEALGGDGARIVADDRASGGRAVESGARPGVLLDGPEHLHLARGAYRARFALRARDAADAGATAVLQVFAEQQLLASRAVTARELPVSGDFADIPLPFVAARHGERIAVRIEATGSGGVLVDRVRIEPDLRATLRGQLRDLSEVGR
jgi:hypothetical protein